MHKISLAAISDIPKIMEVAEATWKQTYYPILTTDQVDYMYAHTYTTESIEKQMKGGVTFLIAEDAGKVLGFAAYEYRKEEPSSPEGRSLKMIFVPKIYIKPEIQRKGVGKKLLSEIEKLGGENNCHFIELNVNRNNPAKGFYERLGFFMHQPIDIPIGPYWMNDFVMRKSIQFVAP